MNNLVNINYNLVAAIETELTKVNLIAVIDDETLTLARKERAGLNKIITAFETERKKLKKQIDDEFKSSLKVATDLLAVFDERIVAYDNDRKLERLAEIREYFDSKTVLKWELAPQDEFLKAYPSYKTQVDLWISKIEHEKTAIAPMGENAVKVYEATYDLAQAIAVAPAADETPVKTTNYTSLTIVVPNEVKDEVITYLKSKGVMVE